MKLIIHETMLRLALASIPICTTIIHPALGMVAAFAVVSWLSCMARRET